MAELQWPDDADSGLTSDELLFRVRFQEIEGWNSTDTNIGYSQSMTGRSRILETSLCIEKRTNTPSHTMSEITPTDGFTMWQNDLMNLTQSLTR